MRLVITEKPSVAMALASVIGARSRRDGFVEGNGYLVSWCVGHLVGLCDAADYDERYRKWNYDDLPIIPEKWKKKILEGTKKVSASSLMTTSSQTYSVVPKRDNCALIFSV